MRRTLILVLMITITAAWGIEAEHAVYRVEEQVEEATSGSVLGCWILGAVVALQAITIAMQRKWMRRIETRHDEESVYVRQPWRTYHGRCSQFELKTDDPVAIKHPYGRCYCACRWSYVDLADYWSKTTEEVKQALAECRVIIRASSGARVMAEVCDWGPSPTDPIAKTRAIDLSPMAMKVLGVKTDDEVLFYLQSD